MRGAGLVALIVLGGSAWAGAAESPTAKPLTDDLAVKLVRKTAAFAQSKVKRKDTQVMHRQEMDPGKAHYVEFQWKEGKTVRTGLAVIASTAMASPPSPWLAQQDGWGVLSVQDDKTLAGLLADLLRARMSANEAATVGDIRTVISAQAVYQGANGGFYGDPRCLLAPWDCVPNYTRDQPAMLTAQTVIEGEKSGYRRRFHAGPAGADTVVPPKPARRSRSRKKAPPTPPPPPPYQGLTTYAMTAVPVTPGQTGVRGFCGDASGRLCFTPDGTEPAVLEGTCDPSCADLQ